MLWPRTVAHVGGRGKGNPAGGGEGRTVLPQAENGDRGIAGSVDESWVTDPVAFPEVRGNVAANHVLNKGPLGVVSPLDTL
jgi:hypothetical protein